MGGKYASTIHLYANLMEEVKIRLATVEQGVNGLLPIPAPLVQEVCFLQFRMVCELIALGCLVAHGDITAATRLKKEYSADRILKELENLHSDFYPQPVNQDPNDHLMLTSLHSGYLTKAELLKLYGRCGDMLHRGNLKKLVSPTSPTQGNFPEIFKIGKEIHTLLRFHLIQLFDRKTVFGCMLRNSDDQDRVQVFISGPAQTD